jgi:hypothetical protein
MPRFQIVIAVAGLLAGSEGRAGELHRCVGPGGAITYQDTPCGAGSIVSKTIAFEPEPVVEAKTPAKSKGARAKPPPASKGSARPGTRRASGDRAQRRTQCDAARAQRDAAVARSGLHRTFEQLRALEDRVYEACKGL